MCLLRFRSDRCLSFVQPSEDAGPSASFRPISLNGLKRVLRFRQSRASHAGDIDREPSSSGGGGSGGDRGGAMVLAQPDLYEEDYDAKARDDDDDGDKGGNQHQHAGDPSPSSASASSSSFARQFNLGLGSSIGALDGSSASGSGLRHRASPSRSGDGASYTLNIAHYGHHSARDGGHLESWRDDGNIRLRSRTSSSRVEHSELPYILLG